MITYKWLTLPTESDKINAVFIENGGDPPNPALSVVRVAENEVGEVVGLAVLQLVPHLEPVWIDPEYRAKVSWREFQTAIEGLFDKEAGGGYYTFASNPRVEKLCRRSGMVEVPLKAFRKEIQ